MLIASIVSHVEAASYSKTAYGYYEAAGCKYRTQETARYYDSGTIRWSYSNHSGVLVSWACLGAVYASPYDYDSWVDGSTQVMRRATKVTITDYNYVNHTGNAIRTYKFNTSTNTFE